MTNYEHIFNPLLSLSERKRLFMKGRNISLCERDAPFNIAMSVELTPVGERCLANMQALSERTKLLLVRDGDLQHERYNAMYERLRPRPPLTWENMLQQIDIPLASLNLLDTLEYKVLVSLACESPLTGGWPLLLADLLNDPAAPLLFTTAAASSISAHPSSEWFHQLSLEQISQLISLYEDAELSLSTCREAATNNQAIPSTRFSPAAGAFALTREAIIAALVIAERAYRLFKEVWTDYRNYMQQEAAKEQAVAEEKERQVREFIDSGSQTIEHSEDFVDRFDRNSDIISRAC